MNIYSKIKIEFGVTEQELKGRSREQRLVEVRHAAWYILRKKHTLREIAKFYNRTHATVYAGIKRTQGLLDVHDRKMTKFINILSPVDGHKNTM